MLLIFSLTSFILNNVLIRHPLLYVGLLELTLYNLFPINCRAWKLTKNNGERGQKG